MEESHHSSPTLLTRSAPSGARRFAIDLEASLPTDKAFEEGWKKVVPNIDPPRTPSAFMKPRPATPTSIPSKLTVRLSPILPDWKYVPDVCRNEVAEWEREMIKVGDELLGLLSEGLGLAKNKLKEMTCLDGRTTVNHYYPYCPQPDLTVGITSHTDPVVVTVLAQNDVGGLQVKNAENDWVDVEPVPGALVINIGDILRIMSNDEYKSVEHRVLANPLEEPRISVVFFFNPGDRENIYGPIPEIVSSEKPPVYRNFPLADFLQRFLTKELDGKSLINYYRL